MSEPKGNLLTDASEQFEAIPEGGGPTASRSRRVVMGILDRPVAGVLAAFILIVIVFSVLQPEFFPTLSNARSISLDGSVTLILAAGVTYVLITGNLDLSLGSVLVFSGVVSAKTMETVGGAGASTVLLGLVVAVLAGALWGAVNGFLVTKARLNSIIVTLATMGSALGLAQVITDGQDLVDVPVAMTDFGNGRTLGVANLVYVALLVVLALGLVLAKTKFGRHTYAIGSNEQAARRAALPVDRHLFMVFTMCGALCGLAGWLSLARFSTTGLGAHNLDSFNALTGTLLGGISLYGGAGLMLGVLIGTLIPVVLANGLVISGLPSFWQQVATGAVLLAAVYIDRVRREGAE